jgi:hypothetical protein
VSVTAATDVVDFQSGMVYFFASLQEGRNVFSIVMYILLMTMWSPGTLPAGPAEGAGAPLQLAPSQLRRSLLPSRGKESVAPGSREVFTAVEQGLAAGNVDQVSAHLDSRVYMQLRGSDGGYHSSTQAYYILSAFLKAHKPASIVFTTYGETDGAPYATGAASFIARGVREDLQIYVALHLSGDRWVITHLNMY